MFVHERVVEWNFVRSHREATPKLVVGGGGRAHGVSPSGLLSYWSEDEAAACEVTFRNILEYTILDEALFRPACAV